jgi:hypothetical protein
MVDPHLGRIVTPNLSVYLIPVNADVTAAIGNAVYRLPRHRKTEPRPAHYPRQDHRSALVIGMRIQKARSRRRRSLLDLRTPSGRALPYKK